VLTPASVHARWVELSWSGLWLASAYFSPLTAPQRPVPRTAPPYFAMPAHRAPLQLTWLSARSAPITTYEACEGTCRKKSISCAQGSISFPRGRNFFSACPFGGSVDFRSASKHHGKLSFTAKLLVVLLTKLFVFRIKFLFYKYSFYASVSGINNGEREIIQNSKFVWY